MGNRHTAGHVALFAGLRADGSPAYEVVPAERLSDGLWRVLGTPALALGCAAGDVISVDEAGRFAVTKRGGNVSVVSYAADRTSLLPHLELLQRVLGPHATVEAHPDGRSLVATLPVAVGFATMEGAMAEWSSRCSATWSYGNVYDERDQPLNWW